MIGWLEPAHPGKMMHKFWNAQSHSLTTPTWRRWQRSWNHQEWCVFWTWAHHKHPIKSDKWNKNSTNLHSFHCLPLLWIVEASHGLWRRSCVGQCACQPWQDNGNVEQLQLGRDNKKCGLCSCALLLSFPVECGNADCNNTIYSWCHKMFVLDKFKIE